MKTKNTLEFSCDCGKVGGTIDAKNLKDYRAICYCNDCQAYARYLGRQDLLDKHGGTDVIPVTPAKIKFTQGQQFLKCLRLSDKGMYRWYADCCKTPIANIPENPKIPYVGLLNHVLLKKNSVEDINAAFGVVHRGIQAKFALGTPPVWAAKTVSPGFMLRVIRFALRAKIKGEGQPSPFLNENGDPKVQPQVLSASELSKP